MTIRILFAAIAATAVAACGGATPASNPTQGPQAAQRKAMLDYAQCMRDHGVQMDDPTFSSDGGGIMKAGGPGDDPEKMRTADTACAHIRDAVKPPAISESDQAEFRKAALANAKCMRDHGVDMPDPQFDASGRASIRMQGDVDPNGAKFQAAQKACASTMPKFAKKP